MYAEFLALVASFCTALSTVLATKGMRESNADSANLVMTGVQTAMLTALLITDMPPLDMEALMWFALSASAFTPSLKSDCEQPKTSERYAC
jgi:uncharacterized membrane protein